MLNKIVMTLLVFFTVGCASMKEKYVGKSEISRDRIVKSSLGKTPKEVVQMQGKPISVGVETGNGSQYVAYPVTEGEISLWDFTTLGDKMDCFILYFDSDNEYKFSESNRGILKSCSNLKRDHRFEDSFIK